jgi:hypothetical protein
VLRALDQILLACQQSCAARRRVAEGTAEWHKRTGEILAYGNMTHVFIGLHESLTAQELNR